MKAAIVENIEMKLFATFGSPIHLWPREKDTNLVPNQTKKPVVPCKEKRTEEVLVKQKEKDAPATMHVEGHCSPQENDIGPLAEVVEIEMDVLQPYKDVARIESGDPSVLSFTCDFKDPSLTPRRCKANKLKWRRTEMKTIGLVVKDVICLPYDTFLKQDDLYHVPNSKERECLASMGLVARITIDSSWLSEDMEGRLASLFKHRFCSHAEKFQFTYLQCFQGSRVLFNPSTPGHSWSAQEVLKICENGCLYVLCHYNLVDTVTKTFSDPLKTL